MAGISEICDIERLKRSNDLAWKWFSRSSLSINKYISWIINLKKNAQSFKKTLPVNMRSAFAKDLNNMFYAKEVENAIVIQYLAMVKHIIGKLVFPEIIRDELESMGLIAIRNAVWQYRNVAAKCGFTTYVHNSIYMRLTGEISKHSTLKKRRLKKCTVTLHSDMSGQQTLENLATHRDKESDLETQEILQKVIEQMNLKDHEKYLFSLLINRSSNRRDEYIWYSDYLKKSKSSFPKGKISKEGLRLRVLKLQKSFWIHWHTVQGLPIPVMPKPKMHCAI